MRTCAASLTSIELRGHFGAAAQGFADMAGITLTPSAPEPVLARPVLPRVPLSTLLYGEKGY